MKLTITLPELEAGYSIQGGPKDRMSELRILAHRREPISITPVRNHDGKTISAIIPTEEANGTGKTTSTGIHFRPVWCKLFTLCSAKKDTLVALICEFDFGKYWIDREGTKKCTLTTSGNGCDPKVVANSEVVLGEMLCADRRNDIMHNVVSFIQKSF